MCSTRRRARKAAFCRFEVALQSAFRGLLGGSAVIVRRKRAFAVINDVDRSEMSVVAVATFTSSQSAPLPGGIGDPVENAGVSLVVSVVSSDTLTFAVIIKVSSAEIFPRMT